MTLCRELKYKRLILRNACGSTAVFMGNICRLDLLSRQAHAPQPQVAHLRQYRGIKQNGVFALIYIKTSARRKLTIVTKAVVLRQYRVRPKKSKDLRQRAKEKIGVSRKACARTPIFRCRSCFFGGCIGLPFYSVLFRWWRVLVRAAQRCACSDKHPPQCQNVFLPMVYA